ncbi:uncharacterized protein LOC8075873 [Sorghum bicolor]|jgi:hypothetical protein|uniref:Senescence regulator n=1 Tax=Sorghum bicolor TaxID=4558 RepID=C5WM57_SORBI|nr:uncharacterized protein LOC8075873 [Sorghum bicolor]EER94255.1 hypothetical protein SORBI_3001G250600 [Sorghum bicolor]|eukprot:XP_002467257.1 uncharacterized protein LOC8075873 [Sorghum bicolor]
MDSPGRPRRSPPADRFLGLFSSPSHSLAASSPSAGDELLEGDLLFPAPPSSTDPPPDASKNPHLGLLAALHEGDRKVRGRGGAAAVAASTATAGASGTLLRRKATIAAAAAAASASSVTPSLSPTSASRAIPVAPRPRDPELPPAAPYHQSAPVLVPVPPPWSRGRKWDKLADGDDDDEELFHGDAAMLPPHEMVARASAGAGYASPGKPSSMLEGVGRTLKGRDLRRVRDAVLRQTGFLD